GKEYAGERTDESPGRQYYCLGLYEHWIEGDTLCRAAVKTSAVTADSRRATPSSRELVTSTTDYQLLRPASSRFPSSQSFEKRSLFLGHRNGCSRGCRRFRLDLRSRLRFLHVNRALEEGTVFYQNPRSRDVARQWCAFMQLDPIAGVDV